MKGWREGGRKARGVCICVRMCVCVWVWMGRNERARIHQRTNDRRSAGE